MVIEVKKEVVHFLADPYLAYQGQQQAETYLQFMKNEIYYNSVHGPFRDLIIKNIKTIIELIKNDSCIHFFDLGPGYPDKTLPVMRQLRELGINFVYRPYDVNQQFLDIACTAAKEIGAAVEPLMGLFEKAEELTESIKLSPGEKAIAFLGLTFMNFDKETLQKIFIGFDRFSPQILIGARLRSEDDDIYILSNAYRNEEADNFAFGVLQNKGFDRSKFQFDVEVNSNQIEMAFTIIEAFNQDGSFYEIGEKFLTVVSRRYTFQEFKTSVSELLENPTVIMNDEGSQAFAIGPLGKQ
jgi:uncharacterized SAM-dependent methyltransferase